MATFSSNQVNHVFVAGAYDTNLDTAGDIAVNKDVEGNVYFSYVNVKGEKLRSALINPKKIMSAKVVSGNSVSQKRPLKSYKITLNSAVNSGNVIDGKDYVLDIIIRQAFGMSDDNTYFKFAAVKGATGMTADDFYAKLYKSLVNNFSREANQWFEFNAGTAAAATVTNQYKVSAKLPGASGNSLKYTLAIAGDAESVTVSSNTVAVTLTAAAKTVGDFIRVVNASAEASALISVEPAGTATTATTIAAAVGTASSLSNGVSGVTITEKLQPYTQGIYACEPVLFDLFNDEELFTFTDVTSTYVGNGYDIADLEYFALGERGDLYRNIGRPNSIPTKGFINSVTSSDTYNIFSIHFYFDDSNESVQKSEQDITIAVKESNAVSVINAITAAFAQAAGWDSTSSYAAYKLDISNATASSRKYIINIGAGGSNSAISENGLH